MNKCKHSSLQKDSVRCKDCKKLQYEIFNDVNDIDPTCRVSQQPHGEKCNYYCGQCEMFVAPDNFDGSDHCPYHQYVRHNEEGSYLQYDEFNQDGEEW